jgi:hypothetical protein
MQLLRFFGGRVRIRVEDDVKSVSPGADFLSAIERSSHRLRDGKIASAHAR